MSGSLLDEKHIQQVLDEAVASVRDCQEGRVADYIPELAQVDAEFTGVSVRLTDGRYLFSGDSDRERFSLQSVAKLVLLIGLLEEFGEEQVFSWVKVEPSGDDFSSVARLDQFGPLPSNPMLNAGAIALSSHIPGNNEARFAWLNRWVERLFGKGLAVNMQVFASERRTGDRNRALAYLMKSNNVITGSVEETLEHYFYLCSFEASLQQSSYLPYLLAHSGCNSEGMQIISKKTVQHVNAIMATCGLYNESGTHLVRTGMPAKSGVAGYIVAVVPETAGIAVLSPRINQKGTSVRGEKILAYLANELNWHFYR
ncbi:glutaminase A [Piscirickettsia litoralis]|uniref:Glutaminase n=1 Tax=Piscirickettsia litoralis TaxID=1891921 RepID=A0ABX3A9Q1_9GAMM|nr:glutaminase A [Piscirickettsia litoralis]ODN42854.1 glutaminase A [Piscirickettsia litoralis]